MIAKTTIGEDIIIKGPQISENSNLVIREKNGKSMLGIASIAKEGMPLNGKSLITVKPINNSKEKFRVVDEYDPNTTATEKSGNGPAMVNSQAYRDNWDKIFN